MSTTENINYPVINSILDKNLLKLNVGSSTIDTTPMLTITAKTGSIINVYDGNIFLGKAKEVSDGVFTFTPKKALLIGEHNFSVSYNAKSNIISDVFAIKIVEKIDVDIEKKIPLTLSFTADTGSIVNVYDGEKFLGIATETSTGKFSLVTEFLSEGNHNFYTKIVKTTPPVTVIIDNNLPKSPVLISVKDNNNIPIYNTTDDLTPTFVFSADSKSVVAIYDNDIFLGNAVETDDGIFTFTSEKLNLGNHSISAREINSSGKLSTNSLGYMLTIKNAEPTTTTDNNTENTSSEKMTTLHFTAENGSIVKVYDGNNLLGIATEISPGKFSFILNSLSEGDHSFSAAVTKSTTPFSLFIDKTPPISPVLLNVKDQFGNVINDKTSNTSPIFTFSAETNTLVSIYDGSSLIGQASEITKGVFAFSDATLSLGSHNITAKSMDFSGNMSDISANYLLSIIQNGQNISQTPTLTFNADAGSIVDVYDGKTLLGRAIEISAGKFSFTPTYLSNGNHSFTASIIKSTIPYSVIIDSIAPAAPILAYIKDDLGNTILNKTDDVTPTFTFYAEDSSVVAVYDDKNLLGNATEIAKGIFTFTAPKLTLGDHNITADAVDKSENKSLISDSYKISINGVIQNTTTSTLTFNAEKGSTVSVFDGKKLLGTAVEVSPGTFTYTPTLLAEGSHYFSIMVTKNTLPYVLELDVTAPNAPSILSVIEDSGHTIYSYTEDRTPTFNFSAEPGSALMLYDGTTLLGKATEISSGKFSFTPTSLLTIGNHSVIATAKDKAGNVSNASIPYVFFINEPYVAPIPTNTVEGYIIAGPVLSGNDLSITLYQGDGTTQIGTTGKVDNTGKFSINVGTYTGVVIAKLVNPSGATVDYMDEATGSAKDVTASLMSVGIVTSGTLPLNVNVLTTVAAIKAGVGSRVITSTAVIQANAAVASVFGLTDLTNSSIITTITTTGSLNSDYNPTDSVNNAEKYGAVLAALSGVDANTSMQATIDALTGGLSITGSVGTLDNVTLDAVIVGARVAASKVAGTAASSLTAVVSNAAMKTSNSISINHIATDDVINISEQTTTITGTVFANASVQLTIGRDNNHSVNADGSGNWNYALTPADISAMGQGGETIIVISGGESASRSIVVDTVAPTTTIVTLTVADNVGSITGNLTSGGVTDDTGLVLNGTLGIAILGSDEVIAIYDGATRLGTATVSSNTVGGAWTFVDARTLTNAQAISYTARAEDAAGNQGTASSAFTTTVDTTAPTAGTLTISNKSNSQDAIFDLALSGQENGATVVYQVSTDNGSSWSTTQANQSSVATGSYQYRAMVTDAAGNSSYTSSVSAIVDTTAPSAPTLSETTTVLSNGWNASEATSTIRVTLPTTGSLAVAGDVVTLFVNGSNFGIPKIYTLTSTDISAGHYDFIVPKTDFGSNGTKTLSASIKDVAGNLGASGSLPAFTLDTVAPSVPVVTMTDNLSSTTDTTPTLTIKADTGSTVKVYDGSTLLGTATENGLTGVFTFTSSALSVATHSFKATATDALGNISADSTNCTLNIVSVPSAASIFTPLITNDTTPVISGLAPANTAVTVNFTGATYTVTSDASGVWRLDTGSATPTSGTLSVNANGNNYLGITSPSSINSILVVDTTAPASPVITSSASTNTNTPTITGTAESGAIISAVIGGITYKTTATGGNWSITPNSPLNANETIPITVTATDAAGNVSALPATQNLKIDAVTITSSDSTYSNAPTLTGTAEATSTIAVSIAGAIYKTPSDGSGNWIVDTSLATSIGGVLAIRANENNAVSVWAMDSDGNVSASPTVQNLKVDGIVITSPTSTNSNTPTISGTAEPSALITAVVAGTTYPTTTVAGNGSWSIAIGTLLDNSNNSISVTATDSTGHISSSATTQTLTVDKTPPTISSIVRLGSTTTNLDVLTYRVKFSEDVTGVDTNDFSLAGTTGTISDVTQISGTIYDVTISGGNLASLSSNTSVTLSIASSPTIADIATNTMLTSASSAAFTLSNTVTPSITSTTTHSLGGIAFTDNKTPTLAITAEANSAVMVFDQGTFVGMASGTTNSSSYSFTPSADLWAGKHSFTFKTVDSNHTVLTSSATAYPLYIGEIGETKASDSSHTNNFLFTVDRTSPYSQDITVSSNLANYNFKIGGLNGITGYNKMVYEYIDQDYISHGQSQLQANLTTVNSVSPASEFTEPVQATDSKTVGSVTNTWDVGKLTNSYDFKLKNGNTLLYTSDLLQVNVLSKPAVDSLAPTQPIVTNNSGTLNITAEALSKVLVFDNNAYVGLATEIGTTTAYTFTPSSLSSDHHINVIAIDDAGNVSPIGFVGIY